AGSARRVRLGGHIPKQRDPLGIDAIGVLFVSLLERLEEGEIVYAERVVGVHGRVGGSVPCEATGCCPARRQIAEIWAKTRGSPRSRPAVTSGWSHVRGAAGRVSCTLARGTLRAVTHDPKTALS